jgi:hypothetical protein
MADEENTLTLGIFEGHNIRQAWHDDEWYFSVVDAIQAYWTMRIAAKLRIIGTSLLNVYAKRVQLRR